MVSRFPTCPAYVLYGNRADDILRARDSIVEPLLPVGIPDTNAGLDWLERAYDEQSPRIGYLRVDPRVDSVRSHPRFESLLRKTRVPF